MSETDPAAIASPHPSTHRVLTRAGAVRAALHRQRRVWASAVVIVCLAVITCATVSQMGIGRVQIWVAGASLLAAFISLIAWEDLRGKAAFLVFGTFALFVALRHDAADDPPPSELPIASGDAAAQPKPHGRPISFRRGLQRFAPRRETPGPGRGGGIARFAGFGEPRLAAWPGEGLQLQLDSVHAIQDGSWGTTDWRFDIYVNRHLCFTTGRNSYNDRPASNMKKFYNKQCVIADSTARASLDVRVQGIRTALFGNYVATGGAAVELDGSGSAAARPVRIEVAAGNADNGQFTFFLTLSRGNFGHARA